MAAVDQQRHRVEYATAANASALVRTASLTGSGQLRVNPNNWFVQVLPDLATGAGQRTRFPLAVTEYVAMAGVLTKVSAALGLQHMAWHMHPDRLSQLLADADATGFLDFSVAGTVEAASRALLRAADRMAPADRLLDVTDISAAANINMGGSWYEQLRINMLVRDSSLHPLAQFRAVILEGYTLLERGDPAGFFRDLIDTLLETAAPGVAAATTNRAKTAKVVAFWLQTQPEREGFLKFTSPDTAFDELTRRGATTAALRFAPSFDKFWRSEFKELDRLLKHPTDGQTARASATALATQAGLPAQEGITLAATQALCERLKPHLSAIETVALRNASNDDRAGAIGNLLQHKPSGAHAPPGSGLAALDPVSIGRLHNNEDFRALKAELEVVPTGAPIELAGVLAKSKSAAGARFLALGAAGLQSEVFKDLEAVRALASMDGALRAALAVDRDGTKRAEWDVVAKGLAKTLISGNWGK